MSIVIVTTTANGLATIHDPMLVILGQRDWDEWLNPVTGNSLLLQSILENYPDDWLVCAVV